MEFAAVVLDRGPLYLPELIQMIRDYSKVTPIDHLHWHMQDFAQAVSEEITKGIERVLRQLEEEYAFE
jgi:hypothetical protein